jgi:hypothetical protein
VRRLVAPLLVAGLAAVGAGCGGSAGPPMTSGAARELAAEDGAVHVALADGQRSTVDRALADLRRTVATLQRRGQLTTDRAQAILAAVDAVQSELVLVPTTTTTTTTTSPPRPGHKHQDQGSGQGD